MALSGPLCFFAFDGLLDYATCIGRRTKPVTRVVDTWDNEINVTSAGFTKEQHHE